MRSAFNALDREGGGYILEGELRGLLTSLGDALTSGEVCFKFTFMLFKLSNQIFLCQLSDCFLTFFLLQVDAVMRAAKIGSGGEVYYDDFVNNLCQ